MTKALAVILALVVLALGWQSWRMKEASQTIERQGRDLKTTGEKLAKTNSQLIALSILSETNNREQARLYAVAESTNALLRSRQRRIEELKRENEDLRRWADTLLPADVIRMRERPALAGGAAYREWLSQSGKRAARTVLTGMCYSVGSATRQGSSSLTRFIGQSAITSSTWRR